MCSQLSGFTLNELFDCCDDEKYAKFLRFIRNSETYSYSISNIGTILDRVPRYDRFEQIFSAGFDDIIKDDCDFENKLKAIADMKREIFSIELECASDIRKENGRIKWKIREEKSNRDNLLKNISDEKIQTAFAFK